MGSSTADTVPAKRARELIAAGEAQAVDVRDQEAWGEAHAPGAVRIPPDELGSQADRLDRNRGVIVFADDDDAGRSAASALSERGFEASLIEGGMEAWKSEDFTIQPSDDPDDDALVEPDA